MEPTTKSDAYSEEDWLTSVSAVALLEPRFQNPVDAKMAIADFVRDGRVRVCGTTRKFAWEAPPAGCEEDILERKIWKPGMPRRSVWQTERVAQKYPITPEFWALSTNWDEDVRQLWNWHTGSFSITSKRGRKQISGVRFARSDLEKIASLADRPLESVDTVTPCPEPKSRRGKNRGKDWDTWIAELVAFVNDGDYEIGMSALALVDKVNRRLADRGLPVPNPTKVDRAAAATIERLAQRN